MLEKNGTPMWSVDRIDHDRTLAHVRAQLGESTFAAAWEAGWAMSPDRAIAEAIQAADESAGTSSSTTPPATSDAAGLTTREREVLRLLVEGHSNPEIAEILSISPKTVRNHVTNILGKLGVETRTAAATSALRRGLL
jgi:DNA-binding NarL/FixJ family response regulator